MRPAARTARRSAVRALRSCEKRGDLLQRVGICEVEWKSLRNGCALDDPTNDIGVSSEAPIIGRRRWRVPPRHSLDHGREWTPRLAHFGTSTASSCKGC